MSDKTVMTIILGYLIAGVAFAVFYAVYYSWSILSIFSPGFYAVVITWPIQAIPFLAQIIGVSFSLIRL